MKCKRCNGTGKGATLNADVCLICANCFGSGEVNWIEAVVGKKSSYTIFSEKLKPKNRIYLGGKIIETN